MAFAFDAPVIAVHAYLVPFPDVDVRLGNVVNPSWLPFPIGEFSFKMDLTQRIRNFYYYVVQFALRLYADYSMNSIVRRHLPNSPLASELSKNVSLIFDTSDPILSSRPTPPYMISLAGIHIGAASALPEVSAFDSLCEKIDFFFDFPACLILRMYENLSPMPKTV